MSKYCFVYKTNDSQQKFHRFPTDKEKLQIIKKPQWRTCLRPDVIPDVQAVKSIDHETQKIDILMDWTPQNSPNRNLVLSEMSSSASSTKNLQKFFFFRFRHHQLHLPLKKLMP
ncbi:hypothetical protein JTB14_012700 [Gonioctena quinquepunctata]|nr:hypothetical protein JTB14_012700 [Gonioctena quinquepunctata]